MTCTIRKFQAVSVLINKPMVFKRKEAKNYGCKKLVEGIYKENDRCLLIEDVVVYGTSIIETTEVFFVSLIDNHRNSLNLISFKRRLKIIS